MGLMEVGTENKEFWYCESNPKNTALRNTIWPTATSTEMFASWVNPTKTAGGNRTKRPETCPSETTPYGDRLSTIITLRE